MESSVSSDTEDEVFFGPILAKENRIASKLRRRTEIFDPNFRKRRFTSSSDSSGPHAETSLSDVFESEENSPSMTELQKSLVLPQSPAFKGESPAINSPLPRNVERTKSKDIDEDQKESPFQMKGKALLDLIYKTKEEWSSPTRSPCNMAGSGTRSPLKRAFSSSLASDSGVFFSENVPKRTCALQLQDNDIKEEVVVKGNLGGFTEKFPDTVTGEDQSRDDEMMNKKDFNCGSGESNVPEDKVYLLRKKNKDLCQNLSSAFEESSKAVLKEEESNQLDDSSFDVSRQEDNEITGGEALWVEKNEREKRKRDFDDSTQSKASEIMHSNVSYSMDSNDGVQEISSVLKSDAISSIQSFQPDSLDSSVWSEYLSEQEQIDTNESGRQKHEMTQEISVSKSCSACNDTSSNKTDEISQEEQENEKCPVTAPLSAFTKVNSNRRLGEISAASLKDLSFRKFTPSMSSSPRGSVFESPNAPSKKDLNEPAAGGKSELGNSIFQDSTNLVQQVNFPKYFPAITSADNEKTDSTLECVGSPEPMKMTPSLKAGQVLAYSSRHLSQETHTTNSCLKDGTSPTICSVLSPQRQNVVKLQSDSPLQLRRLLEQKKTQLMRLKQAKEEMMQKLTEDNEKHFSLQVENALALRHNMASLGDIQQSPLLRENISRLESSPLESLDENSFDELTRFYTWKNSQQETGDENLYNSPLTTNAINRKSERPHLRWLENLVVDVKELSSPSKPVIRRKSILLKRM